MENKKTKLTISGNPKKSYKNFDSSKSQGKKTVVIQKQTNKLKSKGNFGKSLNYKPSFDFKRGTPFKSNNITKNIPSTSDFERRKLAEQRATKRLKADVEKNKSFERNIVMPTQNNKVTEKEMEKNYIKDFSNSLSKDLVFFLQNQ